MPKARPQLAKLTRPHLSRAITRERLFNLLDVARDRHRAIWVTGPPGAGKTTLVSSWLDARKLSGIWYQVDSGDVDSATFFYYLGQAALAFSRAGQRPLPALRSEYLQDVAGFARRFFRDLFSRLPSASTIVLDNYQDVEREQPFHRIVADAIGELPKGLTLLVISRADPPSAAARLIANESIELLEWTDLRLTLEEAHALLAARGMHDVASAQRLHEQSGGWAAGVTLLLERSAPGIVTPMDAGSGSDRLFDYFASQIFDAAAIELQRFLLLCALLPRMNAGMAAELSGDRAAADLLESLYRRHLFIDRRLESEAVYQFHALFRSFLLKRGELVLPVEVLAQHRRKAALLLARGGFAEEAVQACSMAGLWEELGGLIEGEAQRLLSQGRWRTVHAWIQMMPEEHVRTNAWLEYWFGNALLATDHAAARKKLMQAHALFSETANSGGQILSICGIIEAIFFETSNHGQMDPWIAPLANLLGDDANRLDPAGELRAYAALAIATLYRQPGNPALPMAVERVMGLLDSLAPADQRMAAATFLMVYCTYTGSFDTAWVLQLRGDAIASAPEVSPHNRGLWFAWKGYLGQVTGRYAEAIEALVSAEKIGASHGLPNIEFITQYFRCTVEAQRGNFPAAEACRERLYALANPARQVQTAICNACSAWLGVWGNEPMRALDYGRAAWDYSRRLGSPSYLIHWGVPLVFGLIETGAFDEASERLAEQRKVIAGTSIECFKPLLLCLEARLAMRRGDQTHSRELVRQMFLAAARANRGHYLDWLRPWMSGFCAWALEDDVERRYVANLIRARGWLANSQHADTWPWRWRIHTLGRFEVLIEGEPLGCGRKAPRKPLALLKAIIALGSEGVSETALIDHLWEGEDGDAASRAFSAALHRLRALLGDPDVIQLRHGKLSLDTRRIWIDALALQSSLAGADSAARGGKWQESAAWMEKAITWYRGPFLPEDGHLPWALSLRERLRDKVIQQVAAVGAWMEGHAQHEPALRYYSRGIEIDDLAEPLYQGQMRCCLRLGRVTDGLSAYRRLSRLLSTVLGATPSRETQTLRDQLARPDRPEHNAGGSHASTASPTG